MSGHYVKLSNGEHEKQIHCVGGTCTACDFKECPMHISAHKSMNFKAEDLILFSDKHYPKLYRFTRPIQDEKFNQVINKIEEASKTCTLKKQEEKVSKK